MTALNIISALCPFQNLASAICAQESEWFRSNGQDLMLSAEVVSAYDFVTVTINRQNVADEGAQLYCELKYIISGDRPRLEEPYCENSSRKSAIEKVAHDHEHFTAVSWKIDFAPAPFDHAILNYVQIADELGAIGAAGDSIQYRPGNFSEIMISDDFIVLSQVNYHHAKSTAHRKDYFMRKLYITIPLGTKRKRRSFDEIKIGDMVIEFSDTSSPHNRACGDNIAAKLATLQG